MENPEDPEPLALTPEVPDLPLLLDALPAPPPLQRGRQAPKFRLVEVRVANLRGYHDARLPIGQYGILVGNNNQGKSSILRILNWVVNQAHEDVLRGRRPLSDEECDLLLPANQTAGRARRVTLILDFEDARRARRFGQLAGKAVQLRVSVTKQNRLARLNVGVPRKNEEHDEKAEELLGYLKSSLQFVFVPASRDAQSSRFQKALEKHLQRLLLDKFTHRRQAGAPVEYRHAKRIIETLAESARRAEKQLMKRVRESLPPDLLLNARLDLRVEPQDFAEWLRDRFALMLHTGEHDADFVSPSEVGNGLQSVLDLALSLATLVPPESDHQVVAAIEEPEAFLHPSTQRSIATLLRHLADDRKYQILLTTHSPYFVDEARYGDVVLVREQKFYAPRVESSQRDEINTALMSTRTAEIFFAKGVLLVEGPGDSGLFDVLLRRFQAASLEPKLAHLVVFDVGGKWSFAPWWRLLRSYGSEADRPISWISLFDSDATETDEGATGALLRAARDADLKLGDHVEEAVSALARLKYDDFTGRATAAAHLNELLAEHSIRVFSVDSEWASFGGLAESHSADVASVLSCDLPEQNVALTLARRAGSKAGTGQSQKRAQKHPHLRRKLAEVMPLSEIPSEIREVLGAWFGLVLNERELKAVFANVEGKTAATARKHRDGSETPSP